MYIQTIFYSSDFAYRTSFGGYQLNVFLGPTFYASAVLLMGFEKANIRGSVYRPVIHCAYKL